MAVKSQVDTLRLRLESHLAVGNSTLDSPCLHQVVEAADAIAGSLKAGGKVLLFGNGGSAADASHLAAEFLGRLRDDRPALAAVCLSDHSAVMTAISNDFGFDEVFARQIAGLGRAGDVAFGLSTSGESENVVRGLECARRAGLTAIALTGDASGRVGAAADIHIAIPSSITRYIQELTIHLGHSLCELVEEMLTSDVGLAEPPRFTTAFLDRDGTLNVSPPSGDYITSPNQLQLLPGAAAAVRRLNDAGVRVVVVTNQRGVGRGLIDSATLEAIHDQLHHLLAAEGAVLNSVYVCTHEAVQCECRKPLPGMLIAAAGNDPDILLHHSVMVGDAETDVIAGAAAGTATIRLCGPDTPTVADRRAPDLSGAVEWILSLSPSTCA